MMACKVRAKNSLGVAMLLCCIAGFPVANAEEAGRDGKVERCSRNMGTLAVAEPQSYVLASLSSYKLGSPSTMLRMIAQESGCFDVVERGVAMQNIQQERALAGSGMLQENSNVGGGQLQAADFVMTPSVQFADSTGGIGGAIGGLLNRSGGMLSALGGLAGGLKFKEAETTLLLADVRSGIQVASAEGKASKMDFSLGGWGWGSLGWASVGGYSKTPEGKLIAASLLDNFNRIVISIRDRDSLVKPRSTSSAANAARSTKAVPQNVAAQHAAAQPQMLPASGLLPAGFIGSFTGAFLGEDEGNFNVVVASNGTVSGTGYTTKHRQSFVVAGIVSASGEMKLTGSGNAGSASFNGLINQQTGMVTGQWHWVRGQVASLQPSGVFSGRKQR